MKEKLIVGCFLLLCLAILRMAVLEFWVRKKVGFF